MRSLSSFVAGALTLTLLPLLVACGSGKKFESAPPFEDVDDAKIWLTTASALGVYALAYEPIAVADGEESYDDPACPIATDDGTTLTLEGGCTDASGKEWAGRATVERDGGDRTLELRFFEEKYGSVHLRQSGPLEYEFDADLIVGGFTSIDYQGTIAGEYGARAVFNGSGRVERDGFLPPNGVVHATTVDEVVDDSICAGQPVSGSTTVTTRGESATLTYDGESDCDQDKNARLTVNGEDRGLVSGIYCTVRAVGAKGDAGAPTLGGVALALASFWIRRRRRAS